MPVVVTGSWSCFSPERERRAVGGGAHLPAGVRVPQAAQRRRRGAAAAEARRARAPRAAGPRAGRRPHAPRDALGRRRRRLGMTPPRRAARGRPRDPQTNSVWHQAITIGC